MLNALALLKDQSFGGEDARRALDLIRASTREQHRLIDEVHDVSCIAAGCFDIHAQRIDSLSVLVNTEIDAIRALATAKRVRLETFIDSGAGPLDGDADRLRQVVHNLVAHALASTPTGGNVLVECHGRHDHVELVVRDNGMGIPSDTIQHVFDPLWQMHHARADAARAAGVWLGLAVIHRIVELHGGRIVASSDGHSMGAVFTVRLPLAVTQPELGRARPIEKAVPPLRAIEKGMR
jgi:signal transduction histidine kinase